MKTKHSDTARRRAFWKGFASVFDFSFIVQLPTPPAPKIRTHKQAMEEDAENLRGDWEKVGNSLLEAAGRHGK